MSKNRPLDVSETTGFSHYDISNRNRWDVAEVTRMDLLDKVLFKRLDENSFCENWSYKYLRQAA